MNEDRIEKPSQENATVVIEPPSSGRSQNGDSDSGDWKKELEKQKLELEIEKIKAETAELGKPFYKRQSYLQFSIPAIVSLIAVLASLYFGFLDRNIKEKNEQIAAKEASIADLNEEIKGKTVSLEVLKTEAENKLAQLQRQIVEFNASSEAEKKEKEKFELVNRNLQAEQSALQNRLTSLNSLKEQDQAHIEGLRFDYVKLNTEITKAKDALATANYNAKVARLELPLSQLVNLPGDVAVDDDDEDDGLAIGRSTIVRIYKKYPEYEGEYQTYFSDAFGLAKYNSQQRLRIAGVMYKLTDTPEWKKRAEASVREAVADSIQAILRDNAYFTGLRQVLSDVRRVDERLFETVDDVIQNRMDALSHGSNVVIARALVTGPRSPEWLGSSVFFRILETGFIESQDAVLERKKSGFLIIWGLAGSQVGDIFLAKQLTDKKIEPQFVDNLLKGRRKSRSPKNSAELQEWFALRSTQCLLEYWGEANWTKLKNDKSLFGRVLVGRECKE